MLDKRYYTRITRKLLYIAHKKKISLPTPKGDQYVQAVQDEVDLEEYYK